MNEAKTALAEAQTLDQAGKYREARRQYLRAIHLNPHSGGAFEQYSLFLYRRGKYKEGAKALRIGLKLNPRARLLEALLALHLYRMGRVREAWLKLRSAEARFKKRFVLQAIYAQCSMLIEEYATATRAIKAYLATRPSGLATKDHAFRIQLSLALMRSGALKEAEQELRPVLAEHSSKRARLAKAELLLLQRRCARSLTTFRRLLPEVKADYLMVYIGRAYLCLGKAGDAHRVATAYLNRNGESLQKQLAKPRASRTKHSRLAKYLRMGLLLRGDAAIRLRRHDEALVNYRKASLLVGGTKQVEPRVANAHFELKQYDKTLQMLAGPLKRSAPDPAVLILALRAAVRTNDRALATRCAGRLVKRKNVTAPQLYYAGMAYNSVGRFEQATDLLERGLAIDPKLAGARRELVRAYAYLAKRGMREKRYTMARGFLKKGLKLDPRSLSLQRNMAVVSLAQRRYADALTHAERAYALDAIDASALRLLGRSLAAMGKHSQALVYYAKVGKGRKPDLETATVLVESAASRIAGGAVRQGIAELRKALRIANERKQPALASSIERNIVRAYALKGRRQLDHGKGIKAWKNLREAIKQITSLPEGERPAIRASVVFAAIAAGRVAHARRLAKRHRRQLGEALVPPYDTISNGFLAAYTDCFSKTPAVKARGAKRLEQLAGKVPAPASERLKKMAGSAHARAGLVLFRHGRPRQALTHLVRARRLLRTISPDIRHNIAVAEYYAGKRPEALRALKVASGRIPLAWCNLGVHEEERGAMREAFRLFSVCEQRGGSLDRLKSMLEIKRQLFGSPQTSPREP